MELRKILPEFRSLPHETRQRTFYIFVIIAMFGSWRMFGRADFVGVMNSNGLYDFSYYFIPPLLSYVAKSTAEYIWWLGSLSIEIFYFILGLVTIFLGKGKRILGCGLMVSWLHWLCWHATVLPMPDYIVWTFPPGIPTAMAPFPKDFWFSGHTANAFVIALNVDRLHSFSRRMRLFLRTLAWGYLFFQMFLVITARTHYSIDVIGALFVGYTIQHLSFRVAYYFKYRFPLTAIRHKSKYPR